MRVLDAIDEAALGALLDGDEFFWLDLADPSTDDLRRLGTRLGWHPLVVDDTCQFEQRPKLDAYEDHVLLVFYGAGGGGTAARLVENHLVISGSWVVTVRHDRCDELDELRTRIARAPESSEQLVVYRILDALADTFFPVLSRIDDAIDDLEDQILVRPTDEQLQRVFGLKRELVTLRRVVTPERDLAARAIDEITELPGLSSGSRDYFRDLYDHLIRISDLLDSYRDLLAGAMDVYLSTVSNRLNAVMKQLTIVATIFLPITALTGFFGQNFGWLVTHIQPFWTFAVFGVGGALASIAVLYAWFRRSGFIGGGDGTP